MAGEKNAPLFAALASIQRCVSHFNAQKLANIVWAFATAGETDAAFFLALAKESGWHVFNFKT